MQIFKNHTQVFFKSINKKKRLKFYSKIKRKGINNKQQGKSLKESAQNDSRRFCL
jgi:hypothetical protein